MTTALTIPNGTIKAFRANRDAYPGQTLQDFSEATLYGSVIQGGYEHQFVLSLLYKPDLGDPSPPFDTDDGNGYSVVLDPTKTYTVTFEEN